MKTIIVLFTLLFCCENADAQDATKQETMDWIASKMKDYLITLPDPDYPYDFRQFVSYQNGIFTYKRNYEADDEERSCGFNYLSIDLNRVMGYTRAYDNITITGVKIIFASKSALICDMNNFVPDGTVDLVSCFAFAYEQNLVNRLENALKHLVNLNTMKPGEKF